MLLKFLAPPGSIAASAEVLSDIPRIFFQPTIAQHYSDFCTVNCLQENPAYYYVLYSYCYEP